MSPINDTVTLTRPFRLLRKGAKSWEKLPHTMPFGRETLPKLCIVHATSQFELSSYERLAMEDAKGTPFMLTFLDLQNGPYSPPRYQAWRLASKRKTTRRNREALDSK